MIRIVLRLLNAPALLLMAMAGVAIQTSFFASSPLNYIQPDLLLVLVVWFALKRDFTEGGILTLILGDIAEIHSSSPQGVMLVSYMAIYLLVRVSSKLLVIPNIPSLVLVTIAVTVFWKLANLGILALLGAGSNQWRHTLLFLSPGAVANGLLGLWLFRALDRFDWVTYKNARAQQILEDEFHLESNGI